MRKCRNWQTSKTKDLVIIAIVWVQVPSSALTQRVKPQGLALLIYTTSCFGANNQIKVTVGLQLLFAYRPLFYNI